jgi:hypothetical protein
MAPTARRNIAFPELLLPKVRLGKFKVIVKTLRLKTTLDVCAINELDALESVFSLLHPVNAGSDMFRNFLRAPSPQDASDRFSAGRVSGQRIVFWLAFYRSPQRAVGFRQQRPAIFLTFRAGFGLETGRRTRT